MGNRSAWLPRLAWPAWRPGRGVRERALGIGISSDGVRAVRIRGADIEWSTEQAITEMRQLDAVLDEVLAETVRTSSRLRGVTVAVGPSCTQLRRLTRLPLVPARMLEALIQENASRFFLRNGVPVVTTSVVLDDDGSVWAGAVEQPVLTSVANACARHRLRLMGVVPSVAVLHHGLTSDSITWFDGEFAAVIEYECGRIVACRRVPSDQVGDRTEPATTELQPELRKRSDTGWRFADAYGAARGGSRPILACHPMATSAGAHPWRKNRVLASGFACVLALIVAVAAPGVASMRDEHRSIQALAALGAAADEAAVAEHQYAAASLELEELRRFSQAGRPVTLILASITEALAPPAMLTSIQLDSAGGTLTALAPSASSVLQQLDSVRAMTDLAIVGPVVPEAGSAGDAPQAVASSEFPRAVRTVRVTIRYKWRDTERQANP